MKSKDEVLKRAVCLLLFADRCALEKKILDGIRRSLKEREEQRKIIIKWAHLKEYYNYFTEKEKRIIETPVVRATNNEALLCHNDFECIEPLSWSLGLIDKLHNYDEFVLDNMHTPLEIGPNHTIEMLAESCICRPADVIEKRREIAMLWYWRCLECRGTSSDKINYKIAIKDIFGEEYIKILEDYEYFDMNKGDFVVKGRTVAELSDYETAKLEVIAERRFYAFEWLCTDDDWDSVDLVC
jgi:hypothetical protein